MTKESVTVALQDLPDAFHLDELVERLIVVEKIEAALKSLGEGKGIPQEEVMAKMREKMAQRRKAYEQGRDNLVS